MTAREFHVQALLQCHRVLLEHLLSEKFWAEGHSVRIAGDASQFALDLTYEFVADMGVWQKADQDPDESSLSTVDLTEPFVLPEDPNDEPDPDDLAQLN